MSTTKTKSSAILTKLLYAPDREALIREMVDALERVEAAQRPHGRDHQGNACECEACEAWDSVKRLLAKLA